MTGRSFLDVLMSKKGGLVNATRTYVVTGRERHVDVARDGKLPYPQRAIRTADFLYIRNFAPDRWPMGSPEGAGANKAIRATPHDGPIETNTYAAFPDMDASPTKAWIVAHQDDTEIRPLFALAFAKRPSEELYDVRNDPDEMKNHAEDPAFAETKRQLASQLIAELTRTGDPRLTGDGSTFDKPPFAGSGETEADRPK